MSSYHRWLLALVIGCFIGPHLFAYIQGYWALLDVPLIQLLGTKSKIGSLSVLSVMNVLGSLTVAALLCAPLARFSQQRPILLGTLIGFITSFILLYQLYDGAQQTEGYLYLLSAIEHAAFIGGCVGLQLLAQSGGTTIQPNPQSTSFRWDRPTAGPLPQTLKSTLNEQS